VSRGDASLLRVRALFCLLGAAESAFVPFIPLLLLDRGLDAQALGSLLALMSAVGFAAGPLWGYLADRVLGRERTLALCLVGTVGGALMLAFAHSEAALALTGSVAWFFRSPNSALADALALDRLGAGRRDAYGSVRLWMSASFAVGAIAWGAVIEAFGIGVMAPVYAACTALNALLVTLVFRGRWPRPLRADTATRGLGALVGSPAVLLFLVAVFLSFAPYSATYNFAAVRIAALGGGAVFVGLAAGLQAGAEVPSMVATIRLARRLRPAHIFAAGAAFYVIVYAVWGVVANPGALAAMRIVAGLGFGLTSVAMVVFVDELVPERLRATGQAAAKAVSMGFAPVVGTLGGGLVYGYLGPPALFVGAGILTALSAVSARSAETAQLRAVEHA
jgi:MFS family permease